MQNGIRVRGCRFLFYLLYNMSIEKSKSCRFLKNNSTISKKKSCRQQILFTKI